MQLRDEIIALYGGLANMRARVLAFRQALDSHRFTVGVPAPIEDELIERIARANDTVDQAPVTPPPPPVPRRVISQDEFRARMSPTEEDALDDLIAQGMASAQQNRRKLAVWMVRSTAYSIDDARLGLVLDILVAQSVINAARKAQLLQPA